MIAALWTYDGWYGPTFSAGEMRDPQRTLPFGLVWGTVIVMGLYALINLVYFRALTIEEMAATRRIAETAATALFGAGGGKVVSFAVLVSTFGCLSATILYSSRIYLPMARDGVFFRGLAAVHPRFHTPGRSLWAQSLWGVVLALSGTYEQLYTYVIFAMLFFHVATAGAVIVLRRQAARRGAAVPGLRLPVGAGALHPGVDSAARQHPDGEAGGVDDRSRLPGDGHPGLPLVAAEPGGPGSGIMSGREAPEGTQAVIRALGLLKTFTRVRPELSLAELSDATGLARTTAHRLLTALESEGLVARNPGQPGRSGSARRSSPSAPWR